jgi:hypothetical protein
VPLDEIKAGTHEVDIERQGDRRARVSLRRRNTIPNKDFVLKYEVARKKSRRRFAHASRGQGRSFSLSILQPPERVTAEDVMTERACLCD